MQVFQAPTLHVPTIPLCSSILSKDRNDWCCGLRGLIKIITLMKENLTPVITEKLLLFYGCMFVVYGKEIRFNPEEVSIRQQCVRSWQE